jgi:choline dehydrogenase-like flavoprotein
MLCASGFGQLHAHHAQESTSPDFTRNAHPMGGTVMGSNAGTSVVDANLRLHGLQNLYICGGSVLPRGGAAMLTGVIVQLALRLADHLATEAR